MTNKRLYITVCYTTKTGESYLAYYHYNKEIAEKVVKDLNTNKPNKLFNGDPIDWNKVDKFFVHEQEEMY